MKLRTLAIVFLSYFFASFVIAQSQSAASTLAAYIADADNKILICQKNIEQMGASLPYDEQRIAIDLSTSVDPLYGGADKLSDLTFLYAIMMNEKDKTSVFALQRLATAGAIRFAKQAEARINQVLTFLKTPALISEGQKLREIVQALRSRLEQDEIMPSAGHLNLFPPN